MNSDFVFLLAFLFYLVEDFINSTKIEAWIIIISNHGVSFAWACLTVRHDAHIVTLNWRLNQILQFIINFSLLALISENAVVLILSRLPWEQTLKFEHVVTDEVKVNRFQFLVPLLPELRPYSAEYSDVSLDILKLIEQLSSLDLLICKLSSNWCILLLASWLIGGFNNILQFVIKYLQSIDQLLASYFVMEWMIFTDDLFLKPFWDVLLLHLNLSKYKAEARAHVSQLSIILGRHFMQLVFVIYFHLIAIDSLFQ